jgi:integrase
MQVMILLAINCGFGQTDVANLPLKAIDLANGWIDYPRPKTAIMRRCPLWPETVAALREAISEQPKAKSDADAGLAFITKYGSRWVRTTKRENKPAVTVDAVQLEFGKLLAALNLKRLGLGFYALRHTFRTVADGAKDQPAIDHIMGHSRDDMASLYRERIEDERLKAVTDYVRAWLWPSN